MSQSLAKNLVHLVYSTKCRHPWISPEHRGGLFAYQAGIFKAWESPALVICGVEDHVHALFSLSKNHALKKIVEEVKKGSSKWMKTEGPRITDFYWQAGYGAFSVSQSNVESVFRYIQSQEEHHRKVTFQDELPNCWYGIKLISMNDTSGTEEGTVVHLPRRGRNKHGTQLTRRPASSAFAKDGGNAGQNGGPRRGRIGAGGGHNCDG